MSLGLSFALLHDAFFAAIAAAGFGSIANPPLKALAAAAILGAVGHGLRFYLMHALAMHSIPASFLGALSAASLAYAVALKLRFPIEVLTFPAILPMVPGIPAYTSMLMLIKFLRCTDEVQAQEYLLAVWRNGFSALFILSALVAGMVMPMLLLHRTSQRMTRVRASVSGEHD
ncbi:MAG: threonine/serine exporter family protein [Desulfovibrionaceae bacterium]|nr:threonine/serine exporter family protein [Desulfovibrionaceae bacterium]